MCFINKMDRTGADFYNAITDHIDLQKDKFTIAPIPVRSSLLEVL